MTAFQVIH